MAKKFKTEIVTPERLVFSEEIESLVIPAERGYLGVLAGHAPLLCTLQPGAITIRGDGHYCRPEVMDWCEANGVDYIFGLTGTTALAAKVEEVADAVRVERAVENKDAVRGFAETTHAAKSWKRQRRVVARIEATRLGLDIRYVVINIGTAE